jgi:hypothetical protein
MPERKALDEVFPGTRHQGCWGESVFATVRHRTVRPKGALSRKTAKLMVFKLVQAAAKTWRRLTGASQLPLVIEGITFTDGVATNDTANRAA